MNILITGGNGFLGSNLAKKFLEQGQNVNIIDLRNNKFSIKNNKLKFIRCDLTKMNSLNKIKFKKRIDVILHCAGQPSAALSFKDPEKEILPSKGMVMIFPASRSHSAFYNGKVDRVMIGVNFYSLI